MDVKTIYSCSAVQRGLIPYVRITLKQSNVTLSKITDCDWINGHNYRPGLKKRNGPGK
jgi:hypothetical protein